MNNTTFEEIQAQMLDIYKRKNADYGNSFEQDLDDEQSLGPARYAIGNKWRRFKKLSFDNTPQVEESIKDTLLDMANYCILTLMWLNKNESR